MTESRGGCGNVRELLEAYVLGALTSEETARVVVHLRGCEDCGKSVRELEHTVAQIPPALHRVAPVAPPAGLRGRLLQQVAAQPRRSTRPFLPLRRSTWALAAAIALLIISSTAYLGAALAMERAAREELAARIDQEELVLEVVDSPRTEKRPLRATPPGTSKAYGKLYTRPDIEWAVLMVARLPSPPPDHLYRVWVWTQGLPVSPGIIPTNEAGFGRLVFPIDPSSPAAYERIEVVAERADAGSGPSGEPVVVWAP